MKRVVHSYGELPPGSSRHRRVATQKDARRNIVLGILSVLVVASLGVAIAGIFFPRPYNDAFLREQLTNQTNRLLSLEQFVAELAMNGTGLPMEIIQNGTVTMYSDSTISGPCTGGEPGTASTTYRLEKLTVGELDFFYLELDPAEVCFRGYFLPEDIPFPYNLETFGYRNFDPPITASGLTHEGVAAGFFYATLSPPVSTYWFGNFAMLVGAQFNKIDFECPSGFLGDFCHFHPQVLSRVPIDEGFDLTNLDLLFLSQNVIAPSVVRVTQTLRLAFGTL